MSTAAALGLRRAIRAPGSTIERIVVLAAAVALLGAVLLFVGHSLQTMTGSAVRSVPLDWQGPVASPQAALRVASRVKRQPGVLAAVPAATGPFAGIEHNGPGGQIAAGAGAILAVPPDYLRHFRTFRLLTGTLQPGKIVLDQQLAATLQARVGDSVVLRPARGVKPVRFVVSGVGLVNTGDVLFQPLNPLIGPAPAQPPANVAILPFQTFAQKVAPALHPLSVGIAAAPGSVAGVQWQVQAQVDPRSLSGSPSNALKRATQIKNATERTLTGQVQFVDNLADSLTSAAGDALYAQALYIMLGVPGALIALGLAYLAALGTVERDRRELALLRARGASRRFLLQLAGLESLVLAIPAGALGAAVALGAVRLLVGGAGITVGRILVAFALCTALAWAGAVAARGSTVVDVLRRSVTEGRRTGRRDKPPFWERLYLDVIALGISGLVYWLTARTGFSAVVTPDSNPTLSLSIYMFLAPAFLWMGATLLLARLRGRLFSWVLGRAAGNRATTLPAFLAASAARRGAAVNRGLVLVGLLLAFGVNLGVFSATYDQQARVDAQLTLGADVVVDAPPGSVTRQKLEQKIAHVPGVAATSAVDHSYAYVGPDLQDTFGVDPATIARATGLRDSYFVGGSAAQMLHRLRARRDAILVSKETITDYSLRLGDLLNLRVLDGRTGHFKVAPFHVAGIVQEFPSAPRDSFMVANLGYLQSVSHEAGPNVIFVKADGDPVAVARRIAQATKPEGTVVRNIRRQTAQTVSSITTVSLSGLSKIEEGFAIVLAAAALMLFLVVGLGERRRELATMAALGASRREIAAFLWTEAALVLAAGLAVAALLGWILSEMLVAMLQHVFDPPPDHLAAPWLFLGGLVAAALGGALLAAFGAMYAIRRLPLGAILREE